MTLHKSDQVSGLDAMPPTLPKANERHGRLRLHYWSFTTAQDGAPEPGDTIVIARLPLGARILGGRFANEGMTAGGPLAGVCIGVSGQQDRYLELTCVANPGGHSFADTPARNFGDELQQMTDIIATPLGGRWLGGRKFNGYILYAVD